MAGSAIWLRRQRCLPPTRYQLNSLSLNLSISIKVERESYQQSYLLTSTLMFWYLCFGTYTHMYSKNF